MLRARGFVSFLNRVGFGHVFPFLRGAVETRALPVVHMGLGINPNQAVPPAGRGRIGWRVCGRASCRRWTARPGTACRGTPRLKQIAEVKFTRRRRGRRMRRRSSRGFAFVNGVMLCRRLRWRRRFGGSRRLRLRNVHAGKSDDRYKSKKFCNHKDEGTKPARSQSIQFGEPRARFQQPRLSGAAACVTVCTGCWTCFWDASNGLRSVLSSLLP
jgi:hypothetical protein